MSLDKNINTDDILASCSSMTLTSKEGNPYWFRSLDFKTNIWENGAHLVSFSKGYEIPLTGNDKSITSSYQIMGMTYNKKEEWLLDGINSEGLLGGLLFLYEGASAEKEDEGYNGVTGLEIITYFLACCKNVDEVCELAARVQVLNIPIRGTTINSTLHYVFVDQMGKTVVLEAANPNHRGVFNIVTKNQTGILTNSPVYEEQLHNLSWFLSQSPEMKYGEGGKTIKEIVIDETTIKADENVPHICKTGTFPATYTSPDRFIRLSVLKALNDNGHNFRDEQMLPYGMGIMRSVFEPHSKGIFHYVHMNESGELEGQGDGYTQYIVVYDIKKKELYMLPYDTITWTRLALNDCSTKSIEHHEIIRHR